jgi:hypothetical protein
MKTAEPFSYEKSRCSLVRTVFCRAGKACGEKIGTVMRTTHYSTLDPRSISRENTLNTRP